MIILISGATHTGKTLFSQKIMEKLNIPYMSLDHLKMGLLRSGFFKLSPLDDKKIKRDLWPIVRELAKTAIENKQSLIIEGDYIPWNFENSFTKNDLKEILFFCLIMSERYIQKHITDIKKKENIIESRKVNYVLSSEELINDNLEHLNNCKKHKLSYALIDVDYQKDIDEALKNLLAKISTQSKLKLH